MTADELRSLADALAIPSAYTYGPTDPQRQQAAAYLRACADAMEAGPVAWRMLRKDDGFVIGLSTVEYPEHRLDAAAKGGCEAQALYPVAMPAQLALRLPEPMTDAELMELYRTVPKGYLSRDGHAGIRVARAIEAETLRRVKEANK